MILKELDKLTEQGLVRKVISPCGELVLYNYTEKCVYEKAWTLITLNARGTVYNIETGEIVAKAFPKFFNFEELDTVVKKLVFESEDFNVSEKADGSLVILYNYKGKWKTNTRGSFTSEQAVKAQEILEKYDMTSINPRFTLMVEIIYPENRIIVDYGDKEELVLLGGFSGSETEISFSHLDNVSALSGMRVAGRYEFKSISDVLDKQNSLGEMEEGFVVRLSDGFRVKFKSRKYMQLARIMSDISPLSMWNHMKDGIVDRQVIQLLPEEFRSEIDSIISELERKYSDVLWEVEDDYRYIISGVQTMIDRKEIALFINKYKSSLHHPDIIFARLDHRFDKIGIYAKKIIRPKGNSHESR